MFSGLRQPTYDANSYILGKAESQQIAIFGCQSLDY